MIVAIALFAAPHAALGQPAPDAEPPVATETVTEPGSEAPAEAAVEPEVTVLDDLAPPIGEEEPVTMITVPPSDTMPEPIQRLIATAVAEGDEAAVAKIVALAKKAFPSRPAAVKLASAAHDARVEAKKEADEQARIARLSNPDPLANWKGEAELGASAASGNTENVSLYVAFKGEREGLNWRHSITARGDLQRTDHVTTTERLIAAWQPNYKFDDRFYAYGIGQYEHDRFLGYDHRYTVGGGIGYSVIRSPAMLLEFEGGPAVRRTSYIAGSDEEDGTAVAGRASVKFKWTLSPNLAFSQDAAVFLEHDNNNAVTTTSLDTRLIGALKARFSYNVRYERDAPPDRDPVDTLSRATLVYSF